MYQPDWFPPSPGEMVDRGHARANGVADPTSPLGNASRSPLGYSVTSERQYGTTCQEENNYRLCQEEKCPQRLNFARAEDAVVRALGLGEDGLCPLPGHNGSAWFEADGPRGERFVCDCLGRTAEWGHRNVWRSNYDRSLADAYEAIWTGREIDRDTPPLKKGERLVWSMLLAHEVGLLEPAHVALPELPPRADELHRRAWDFFGLLAGLRLVRMAEGDALPMAFSNRLVAAYLRVDRETAREAINALRGYGVITVVDRDGSRGAYKYAPGDGKENR